MFTTLKHRIRFALPAMLVFALAAAPAHASSSASGYNGKGDVIDQTINSTTPTAAANAPVTAAQPSSGSSLPFTGFDVTLLAVGGILLVGIGFTMRRLARPNLR
jgi:predicted cobalt transporter CbtA